MCMHMYRSPPPSSNLCIHRRPSRHAAHATGLWTKAYIARVRLTRPHGPPRADEWRGGRSEIDGTAAALYDAAKTFYREANALCGSRARRSLLAGPELGPSSAQS